VNIQPEKEDSFTVKQKVLAIKTADKGNGIDSELLDRLFTGKVNKNQNEFDSTGVGLNIVKVLLEQLKAGLIYNSKNSSDSEKETYFTLFLKLKPEGN